MTRGIGQARDKEDGYEISLELADFFRAFNRRDSLFPSYLSLSLSRARAPTSPSYFASHCRDVTTISKARKRAVSRCRENM